MHASTFHTDTARETGNFNYLSNIFLGDLTRSILPIDSIANTHKLEHKTSSWTTRYVKWNGEEKKNQEFIFNCLS